MPTPRILASLAVALVAALAIPSAAAKDDWPWPPPGPKWETDPEAALQRARDEGKGVMVYVATES